MIKEVDSIVINNLKHQIDENLEFATSCNIQNCVDKNTKVIIVGTITPPKGNGYFYTAPQNRIYGYIDQAFHTNLKGCKDCLKENKNNQSCIDEIIKILKEHNIAFLDVFESVIRKKNSSYDKDIQYFNLDYESFKINKKALYICNSRLAEKCFLKICEVIGNKKLQYIYLSQRRGKKECWINSLLSKQ